MSQSYRIMIVDDEPEITGAITDYLELNGHRVRAFNDAAAALKAAGDFRPEVILLDIMMPKMDGYEFAKALKTDSRTSTTPVIFVSGKSRQDDDLRFVECSGELYIHKPIVFSELQAMIQFLVTGEMGDTGKRA